MDHHRALVFDALLRTDLESLLHRCMRTLNPNNEYVSNWHIQAMIYELERIRRGENNRLIINCPPRYLKSILVSVVFPAYVLGLEPWRRIFAISYGNDLSDKHASDFRSIAEVNWYRRAFPMMQIQRSTGDEVTTTDRGFRRSTSVTGVLTGLGGDLFIIDDPQKPADAQSEPLRSRVNQWVSNTLMSRLDNKETGAIIVVMQRVHMDDLSGYLQSNFSDWTVLSLPAIAEEEQLISIGGQRFYHRRIGEALHPKRESLTTFEELRRTLGSDIFSAQYQQSPVPPGGAMIKRHWLRYFDQTPQRVYRTKVIQSWDCASKEGAHSDWSVCTTWLVHEKAYYLLDLVRGRFDYPKLRSLAILQAERHKPDVVLIEDTSAGIALAQELRPILKRPVQPVKVDRDKIGRLFVQQFKFEAGLVLFPSAASFLAELEAELLAFPHGKTDDMVDSISQALAHKVSTYSLDNVS